MLDSIQIDAPIQRLLVGAHWTAVRSRTCGMASTVFNTDPHGESAVIGVGDLHNMSARQLAACALSRNMLEASIGVAALNSLLDVPKDRTLSLNAFHFLAQKGAGKTIAVFGHFPGTPKLSESAREVIAFELTPVEGEHGLEEIAALLPCADVVAITSNSLINHTLPDILPHIRPGAFSLLLGPSTPLSEILFDYGLDMLAGVRVTNSRKLFNCIGQGATLRQVQGIEPVIMAR